jgi:type III pantothenate kinase
VSNLLIDIGNTRLKWALFESAKSVGQAEYISQGSFSENLSSSMIELCLENSWQIDQIICSSVASIEQTNLIQKTFKENYPKTPWKQINGLALIEKISTAYINPEQLGSDRRAMIIGAQTLFPQKNILIVSAGTATTLDIINAESHHLGGWILPGFSLMKDSLFKGTNRLATHNSSIGNEISIEIGLDTQSAIDQGVLTSQLGAIELAKQYATNRNIQLNLILFCGGNGKQLLSYQNQNDQNIHYQYEDNLVLKGLVAWHQNI